MLYPKNGAAINIVDDMSLAMQFSYSQTCKVIYIGEAQNIPPQFVACPILLPPFEALNAEVDGNLQMYDQIYQNYLNSDKEVYDTVITILTSVFLGINVIFYIENSNEFHHRDELRKFFMTKFGICIGYQMENFFIAPNYIPIIQALLYEFMGEKLIDVNTVLLDIQYETLCMIPQWYPYAGFIFEKMFNDIGCVDMRELQLYWNYLHQFKRADGRVNAVIMKKGDDVK